MLSSVNNLDSHAVKVGSVVTIFCYPSLSEYLLPLKQLKSNVLEFFYFSLFFSAISRAVSG